MQPPESVELVARDLSALSGRDRRAILAALDSEERDWVRAAMRGRVEPAARIAQAGGAIHSPWMVGLIAAATATDDQRMTAAARTALLDAAGRTGAGAPRQPGRSLLQAAGGLLGQAIAR